MTHGGRFDDTYIWSNYERAAAVGDEDRCRELAGQIVETHLPFLRAYANQTAFYWMDADQRAEYLHELVVRAVELVPRFDRHRGAAFITFIKPNLQPVRWQVVAAGHLMKTGVQTRRMKAALERYVEDYVVANDRMPEVEEMSEFLSRASGKGVGKVRTERLLDFPSMVWVDGRKVDSEDAPSPWDAIDAAATPDHAETLADIAERSDLNASVRAAVDVLDLDGLGRAVVVERLMAEAPTPQRVLANRFGVREATVRDAERDIAARLRDLLG